MKKRLGILIGFLTFFLLGVLSIPSIDWYKERLFPQEIKRERLRKILGIDEIPNWPEVTFLGKERVDGIEKRLIGFISPDGIPIKAYILVPEGGQKFPLVIAINGHGSTKEEVVGMVDMGNNADYGLILAKRGFVVLAPDVRFSNKASREEDMYSLNAILYGKSLNGVRLLDILTFLEYAINLPEIDKSKIGCVGWSLGGALAMYLSACDRRIKAVYISGYYCSFARSIMRMRCTTDNYIPGILRFGDMDEIASLIIPRHILIESGEKDTLFPIDSVNDMVQRLEEKYQKAKVYGRIKHNIFPGNHIFSGKGMAEWLNESLKK